jgi:hypothetical protein
MRVELFDSEGNKYTVAFEGQMTREKAVRLLDLVELLGGVSSNSPRVGAGSESASEGLSKYDKVRTLIQRSFPLVWFSSREVQTAYEQEFKEPLALSTAATYLARMSGRGVLTKTGPPNSLKYKTAPLPAQATLKTTIT